MRNRIHAPMFLLLALTFYLLSCATVTPQPARRKYNTAIVITADVRIPPVLAAHPVSAPAFTGATVEWFSLDRQPLTIEWKNNRNPQPLTDPMCNAGYCVMKLPDRMTYGQYHYTATVTVGIQTVVLDPDVDVQG
jgi:hypothetical protein